MVHGINLDHITHLKFITVMQISYLSIYQQQTILKMSAKINKGIFTKKSASTTLYVRCCMHLSISHMVRYINKKSTYDMHVKSQIKLWYINIWVPDNGIATVNPLRAKFFRVNINMYLHSMSFLRTNETQVVEIPPWVIQGPAYTTKSISWLLMSWRRKEPGHQQPWYWPS